MSYAPLLLAIRAHFQLTQTELGAWLGVGRSMLALVETDREQLPRQARPWLRAWEAALAAAPPEELPASAPPAPPAPPTGPAAVLARLAECDYQARRLGQQRARLLAGHRTAGRRRAAGPLLLAALPPPAPAEPEALTRRRRWLAGPPAGGRHRCPAARKPHRPGDRAEGARVEVVVTRPENPTGPVTAALLAARRRAQLHEAALLLAYLQGEGLE